MVNASTAIVVGTAVGVASVFVGIPLVLAGLGFTATGECKID